MITLHRLGHSAEPFHLNPDLIVTVEANPDTVITLTTGTKIVVAEPAERVVAEISEYRVEVLSGALRRRSLAAAGAPAGGGPAPSTANRAYTAPASAHGSSPAERAAGAILTAIDGGDTSVA